MKISENTVVKFLIRLFILLCLIWWSSHVAIKYYYNFTYPECIPITVYHFIIVGMVILLGYGLGRKLLNLLKINFDIYAEVIIFSFGLGLGLLAQLIFFVGILGGLHFWLVVVLILALFSWLLPEIGGLFVELKEFCANKKYMHFTLFEKYVCAIIFLYIIINIFTALVPTGARFGDVYTYHLAAPKVYLGAHRIINIPFISSALMPFTINMLYMLGVLFDGEIACQLIHTFFGILCIGVIYLLSRKYMSRPYSLVSCAIFYTIGFLGCTSSAALIDLGRTFFELLAIYAVFVLWDNEQEKGAKYKNRWLVVAALAMGLALGTKLISWVSLALITLIILIRGALRDKYFFNSLRCAAIFISLSVLVALPWMLRAFFYTGNPVYPISVLGFFSNLLKSGKFNALAVGGKMFFLPLRPPLGEALTFKKVLSMPWQITVNAVSFGGSQGTLSIFYLIFLPFIIFIRKINKDMYLMLLFCLIWLVGGITTLTFRYFIPVWALLSVITSYIIYRLVSDNFMRKPVALLVAILLLLNLYTFVPIETLMRTMNVILGRKTISAYLSELPHMEYYPAFRYINKQLPALAKIYYIGDYQTFYCDREIYAENGNHGTNPPLLDYHIYNTPAKILQQLRKSGFDYVLVSGRACKFRNDLILKEGQDFDLDLVDHPIVDDSFRGLYLYKIFSEKGSYLFKILSDIKQKYEVTVLEDFEDSDLPLLAKWASSHDTTLTEHSIKDVEVGNEFSKVEHLNISYADKKSGYDYWAMKVNIPLREETSFSLLYKGEKTIAIVVNVQFDKHSAVFNSISNMGDYYCNAEKQKSGWVLVNTGDIYSKALKMANEKGWGTKGWGTSAMKVTLIGIDMNIGLYSSNEVMIDDILMWKKR